MSSVPSLQTDRTHANDATIGRAALIKLWNDAVERYREKHGDDTAIHSIVSDIRACDKPEHVVAVIESHTHQFESFRKTGGKLKEILRTIARVLLTFSDAAADMAADGLPGGKFIVVAVTSLLKLTGSLSALYDAMETVLREIGQAFARLEGYFKPRAPVSEQLSLLLLESLVVMLEILELAADYCQVGMKKSGPARFFSAASRRAVDYGEVMKGNNSLQNNIKRLQWLTNQQSLQSAMETHVAVREIQAQVFSLNQDEEYNKIKKWIKPMDTSARYNGQLAKREGTTCNWILEDEDFVQWRDGEKSVYMVLGHAGSGKSVLSSVIIKHLKEFVLKKPNSALAYFYFTSDVTNGHRSLLTSLIFQIALSSAPCWTFIQTEYLSRPTIDPPTNEDLIEILHRLLALAGPLFIVIDALDECRSHNSQEMDEQSMLLEFLIHLHALELPSLHLFVTSRPERRIMAYLDQLQSRVSLDLQHDRRHEEDIRAYAIACLSKPTFAGWNDSLRDGAIQKLSDMKKSQGMFLWVSLQLATFLSSIADEISPTLETLPDGLADTFRGILDRFYSTCSPASRPRVRAILGLIAVAKRPLRVQEVVAAFAFDFKRGEVKPPDPHLQISEAKASVLEHLPSLVEVRPTGGGDNETIETVHFIHFSVKEYLMGGGDATPGPPSRFHIDPVMAGRHITTLSIVARTDVPLLQCFKSYAEEWWFDHIQPTVSNGELGLMNSPDARARRLEVRNLDKALVLFFDFLADRWARPQGEFFRRELPYPKRHFIPPLHLAAELGLSSHVNRLLERNINVDMKGPSIPLTADKTRSSRLELAQSQTTMTALFWTVSNTSCETQLRTIDILLDCGAAHTHSIPRPRASGAKTLSLMHVTQHAPNKDIIIRHLVKRGVNIDARDSDSRTSLHWAVKYWKDGGEWAKALLDHGADPNALDAEGNPPLMGAFTGIRRTSAVHVNTVDCLLKAGADPDLRSQGRFSALQWAAIIGKPEIVELLRRAGADTEGLTQLKKLGVDLPDRGAGVAMGDMLVKLEEKRCQQYQRGLPPLHLEEQRAYLERWFL